jgi:hypothetical protein
MLSRFAAITRISRPWRRLLNRRRTAHAPAQAGPDLLSFAFAAKRRSRRHRGSLAPWTSTRRLGVGSAGFCFAMAKRASAEPSAGLSRFVRCASGRRRCGRARLSPRAAASAAAPAATFISGGASPSRSLSEGPKSRPPNPSVRSLQRSTGAGTIYQHAERSRSVVAHIGCAGVSGARCAGRAVAIVVLSLGIERWQ